MIKTYGINDVTEASYVFPAMKGHLRANFTGGVLDERRKRPAMLTTKNPVVMLILEQTELFKSGKMFIVAQSGESVDEKLAAKKEAKNKAKKPRQQKTPDDGRKAYEDVTTIGDAVNVLMELGAPAADLQDTTTLLETASQLNVSFPNLKLK